MVRTPDFHSGNRGSIPLRVAKLKKKLKINMNEINHSPELIDYCIDNKLTFAEGYADMIEKKLSKLEEELRDLRRDIELIID